MGYCDPEIYERELRKITEKAANIEMHLQAVPYEEIMRQSINADLLFALYDPSIPNNKYASPNKLFEAMMCGKPIIVSEGTSMAKIVEKYASGLVVPCDDIDAIKEAVLRLKNDPRLRQMLGKNGKEAFDSFYNWNIMEKRLLDVYDKLTASS
jgi:glycosyltransferase involved in cell wall biosynthesis